MRTGAPAKINVCLLLGPTRADGRHELVTVFQALDLQDDVSLEAIPAADRDEVVCVPPVDGENLAVTAVRAFRAATRWDGDPVRITITKRIPVAGGMAGGSSDAAAVLRLLAEHAESADGLTVSQTELRVIAAGIGADVPALVEPGRWLGTAAGEVVERLPDLAPGRSAYVIITSDVGLSTPDVFREADRLGLPRDATALNAGAQAIRARAGDLPRALCVNELEPAALSLRPDLVPTLAALRGAGAEVALVSGSGPTCVGLYDEPRLASRAATMLASRFGEDRVQVAGPLLRSRTQGPA